MIQIGSWSQRTALLIVVMAAAALWGTPAAAQQSVNDCTAIAEREARLDCYDGFLMPKPDTKTPPPGAATIASESQIPVLAGGRAPVQVTVTCIEGTLQVWFNFGGNPVAERGYATLSYQVDLKATRNQSVNADPTNTNLVLDRPADVTRFLSEIQNGSRLLVRTSPYNQPSVRVYFQLRGFLEQAEAVRAACPA